MCQCCHRRQELPNDFTSFVPWIAARGERGEIHFSQVEFDKAFALAKADGRVFHYLLEMVARYHRLKARKGE